MDDETVANAMEIDGESAANFVTTNIISHDAMVTCGICKEVITYQEYDCNHRDLHYDLCWLDGVEEEINFTDIAKTKAILRKRTNKLKTPIEFKCQWCDGIYISIVGFASHLSKCKLSGMLKVSDSFLEQSQIDQNKSIDDSDDIHIDDSAVICGCCSKEMNQTEYKNHHRYKHNNLCWLDGEEKLDYLNENKIASLLREILPKHAERDKKVSFVCEWCGINKKSVLGFVSHVKKCAIEQKLVQQCDLPQPVEEEIISEGDSEYDSEQTVKCGRCDKSMLYKEYNNKHKLSHYNLCWIDGKEKPDFDDENVIQNLLRKSLPKNAIIKKKVKFICEWCQTIKKSVQGFASHIKQCQSRPDKQFTLNVNGQDNINKADINERNTSKVTCGRCKKEMTYKEYHSEHCSYHYNLCWIDGEVKLDLENYDSVLSKLRQFIPFKIVRNRGVKLTCEDCKSVKKSLVGFASHVIFCNKSASDIEMLLVTCEDCGNQIKPPSLLAHKLKTCKILKKENDYELNLDDDNGPLYKSRRKKRPPNILSFHPDTKYVTEYYDYICCLCNFIALNINHIINHILTIHNIDINEIEYKNNLNKYILNKYDVHKNIYLKPLLNYYNYSRKTLWKTICHEDFNSEMLILNKTEALKYLPSVQQSCKIFNSDDEKISVDIFKSTYVNGMFWLFTGGPNWAMSWCPVPEDVQMQYLAIACHPKPDLEHKEMDSYKYPSIVQLWTFNSLHNVNYESITDVPYMSYGLAHEFGAVWDMAWCPSGAYQPKNKIGILALSTSCGDCPIFTMPCVEGKKEIYHIYKIMPVIARNFECEWINGGFQCTKVCWQAASPFRTLICGYSNGVVSIFNLNFKSIFLHDDILYPSHTFRASRCSITGLSINCFNSSILATTATDGYVLLWDLKMTENPIFLKKSYSPSDCTWLQQCYTLVYCSKGVNPVFLKVRTINFSNYDDDADGYIPELYVINRSNNSRKVISNYKIVNNNEKLNCGDANDTFNEDKISINNETTIVNDSNMNCNDADDTLNEENKISKNNKTTILKDTNVNGNNESYKSFESNSNSDEEDDLKLGDAEYTVKSGDVSKNIEEEDFYGPTFFQKGTHWTVSGSNWTNIIATGDENGYIYETLFLPETNQMKMATSTTRRLIVRQLASNTPQSEVSSGYCFKDTVEEFGLESKFFNFHKSAKDEKNNSKPLLRYPLDNITKISWNQNFSSFRWLASGTQCGFTLVSPSKAITDSCIELFYKTVTTDF